MSAAKPGAQGWVHRNDTICPLCGNRSGDHEAQHEWGFMCPLTPCDRPYADCTVCKGTGDHDGIPCGVCVWRRWAEDNRDSLATPEEIQAAREAEVSR